MKTRKYFVITTLYLGTAFFQNLCAAGINIECRVRPYDDELTLICHIQNDSDINFNLRDPTYGFSVFQFMSLCDSDRRQSWLSRPSGHTDPKIAIPSGKSYQWELRIKDIPLHRFIEGAYVSMAWMAKSLSAKYICLGFSGKEGIINVPVVDANNPNVEIYIGFIYHEKKAPQLCFLFMNGTSEEVLIEKPLARKSRIVASAPAIEYTRELFIPEQRPEETTIEPGNVGEWRLPWKTVHDLIPAEDLEKIRAAGGDLDLVWKAGEYESPALPVSLAEPTNAKNDAE